MISSAKVGSDWFYLKLTPVTPIKFAHALSIWLFAQLFLYQKYGRYSHPKNNEKLKLDNSFAKCSLILKASPQ